MIRAKDKPVAVDQEQPGTMLGAFPGGGWWHTIRIRQIESVADENVHSPNSKHSAE
jgi:hypothetical protein